MTRIRLTLKDESLFDAERIKSLDGVAGINKVAAQYQIIIGTAVVKVYNALCELGGFEVREGIEENLDEAKEPFSLKALPNKIISTMSECIVPMLPVLMAMALFKMILSLFGPEMLNVMSPESDLYRILNVTALAGGYFFPFFMAYTCSKKFNCSAITALILAAIMMSPALLEIVTAGEPFTVFGIPMRLIDYNNSLIPMLLTVWIMSYVEKFFGKI